MNKIILIAFIFISVGIMNAKDLNLLAGCGMGIAFPAQNLTMYQSSFNYNLEFGIIALRFFSFYVSYDAAALKDAKSGGFSPLSSINTNFLFYLLRKDFFPYIGFRLVASFVTEEQKYLVAINNEVQEIPLRNDITSRQFGLIIGLLYYLSEEVSVFGDYRLHYLDFNQKYIYSTAQLGIRCFFLNNK
ncbi:MAG: hypothetical protein QG635_1642 [Bacteroidota bacterium]|nr:hypothetical protein [Bacteroidota bacterium]